MVRKVQGRWVLTTHLTLSILICTNTEASLVHRLLDDANRVRGLCRGIDTFLGDKGRDLTAKRREIMFPLFLSDLKVTLVENLGIEMNI